MKTDVTLPEEGEGKKEEKKKKPVHVDFSKTGKKKDSPFQKAATLEKRLKLFLYGDSGAGKTTLLLHFPDPVVADMEGGTDLYGDVFDFGVLHATTVEELVAAIDWLLENKHQYKTLAIDPITILWDMLQKKWSDIFLRRNKGSKGHKHEFYDLQVKDWLTIKGEFKEIIRKLIALDMNVIVTAREKTKYKEGSFMVAVGETFDGEKSLPYMFDTIVRMYVDDKGRHMGLCLKDRSNKLPKEEFECSYSVFEKAFGKQYLNKKPKPIQYATQAQKDTIGKYIEQFGMTDEQVAKRLAAYEAEGLDDLTAENAKIIISKFESALKTKGGKGKKNKEKPNAKD